MLTKLKHLIQRYKFNPKITPPKKIFLEITGACSLHCPLCPRTYSSKKRGAMPEEVFKKLITDIAYDYPNLELLGFHLFGEITMRKDCDVLVLWARQRLPATHFGVSTTVSLENKDVIDKLLHCGFDSIGIWPDGFSDDSYAKIRVGGIFTVVKDNIRFLLEERDRLHKVDVLIHVGIVRNIINQNAMDKFYENFQFVEKFKNASLVTVDSVDWAGQIPSKNVLYSAKDCIIKVPKPCSVPFDTLAASATGDITLCCYDMDFMLKIGNIMSDGSIKQIWASETAQTIRRRMKYLSPPALCKRCHNSYLSVPWFLRRNNQQKKSIITYAFKKFSIDELKSYNQAKAKAKVSR